MDNLGGIACGGGLGGGGFEREAKMNAAEFIVPAIVCAAVVMCLFGRVQVYGEFCTGVERGMKTLVNILPAMVAVMSAAAMLRESGITAAVAGKLAALLPFDVPEAILSLAILRPVSGSGSIGLLAQILSDYGADSAEGRIASVIAASSETTLYVLMVYFGATGVKYTKRVLAAALIGDFVCVLTAVWACKIFF